MKYPEEKQEEIASWLEIKIHEVTSTSTQPDTEEFGTQVGDTISILSPMAIIENNTQNYTSTDFKISSAAAGLKGGDWGEVLKGAGMGLLKEVAGGAGTELERMMGQVVNPRSEQFFTGPGFRQFSFHWELAPLTAGDASTLEKIYQTIRRSSYPTLVAGAAGTLYGMPDEFQIKFISGDGFGGDSSDPKFGRCVCTNISINYTGAGIAAVASGGGAPPFVNLDMTFAERTLLNQSSTPIA